MGLPLLVLDEDIVPPSLTCCRSTEKSSFTVTKKQETPFPSRETVTCETGGGGEQGVELNDIRKMVSSEECGIGMDGRENGTNE